MTVIVSTYNWSTVLPYSIGSALRQTFEDFEILVIGDGCTDDSEFVVRNFSDSRVRWINLSTNSGHQAGPNNEGLEQARGTFIAYLGHDDLWLPHYLESQLETFDKGADLAFAIVELVAPDSKVVRWLPRSETYKRGMALPPTGVMHRRHVTDTIGGWRSPMNLSTNSDNELWSRAFDTGFRFTLTPRLGAIKFQAAEREGVYLKRPCHEQAMWTDRMMSTSDFEAKELSRILFRYYDWSLAKSKSGSEKNAATRNKPGYRKFYGLARRSVRKAWSSGKRYARLIPMVAIWQHRHRIKRQRVYKGLDSD